MYQGLAEPEFYDDLVYKLKRNVGRTDFLIKTTEEIERLVLDGICLSTKS